MEIKSEKIKEFQRIYKDKFGEDITKQKAIYLAGRLFLLMKCLTNNK